jgi:hypothetical protein
LLLIERAEAQMRDKTKTWLERAAFAAGIALPVPALVALLVYDSIILLWIYVAVVLVVYSAGLLRKSLSVSRRRGPGL